MFSYGVSLEVRIVDRAEVELRASMRYCLRVQVGVLFLTRRPLSSERFELWAAFH